MTNAGERAIRQAKRDGRWTGAAQAPDLSMPIELNESLKRNKKAAAFFAALAPSYQRQFIAWINAAKRAETRRKRLAQMLDELERGDVYMKMAYEPRRGG